MKYFTLTGLDALTDLDWVKELYQKCPQLELGILYSANPAGRVRYPSLHTIKYMVEYLKGNRLAIHICGSDARKQLLAGELDPLLANVGRVQVNGKVFEPELPKLANKVDNLITQHNPLNSSLLNVRCKNHQVLVDSSGGRGITPTHWPLLNTTKLVGYAGGLSPANLAKELVTLKNLADWVDMESHVRLGDVFMVSIAAKCIDIFMNEHKYD